jgi:hypothetical protein
MAFDRDNPYASPSSRVVGEESPCIRRHEWQGRRITVEGRYLPATLWLVIGYTITLDGSQQFETAQLRMHENYDWQFDHQGRAVTGHFETLGNLNAIGRNHEIRLDGESLGQFKIQLQNQWGFYSILVLLLTMPGLLIYWLAA